MGGIEAKLPPAFSLLKSEFNDFLFATIGEENNDTPLTVLSALARTGIDPWEESARLAQSPTETATLRLASIISGLPNGRWAPSDAGMIAARLIALLPAKRGLQVLPLAIARSRGPSRSRITLLLFFAVLGGLIVFAIANRARSTELVEANGPTPALSSAAPVRVAATLSMSMNFRQIWSEAS